MQKVANIDELENKHIPSLLWQYALPAIVGTLVNSLYNVIDRIFLGHWVGDDAISGLGLVLPIMNLTAAVGMLVGAGSASRISIYLGKKDLDTAEKIAGTSLLLTLILNTITVIALLIYLKPILYFAGASDITYPYARDFLIIFLPGQVLFALCFNFNNMMRASGYPMKAMITMLISVVFNIILAPIFIHLLGWGMKGAATATLISMTISFLFVMQHFLNPQSYIKLRLKNIRLRWNIIKSITSIGLSPFLIQIAASMVIFFIISQLKDYAARNGHSGDMAIGAYTIANTLIMLIVMIVLGLTQGMQPIVGYNYGAKNYNRVKEALIYTIKVGVGITTAGFVLGFFFPGLFVSMFNPGEELSELASRAVKLVIMFFPLAGFQIVVTNFFQCIGQAGKSIFLSLTRQFLFLIPGLFILPHFFGLDGIWLSMPVADIISTITTAILFYMQIRVLKKEAALHNSTI